MARGTTRAEQTHVKYETGGVRKAEPCKDLGTSVPCAEHVPSRKTGDADGSWLLSRG